MGFRDFNDDGPGTFAWDYVLGHNTSGLFPDETHYFIDGDVLEEAIFTYAGGESWNIMIGDCWNITIIEEMPDGGYVFEQDGRKYRASVNRRFRTKGGLTVFDITEL